MENTKYNIFQGNNRIYNLVAKSLNYELEKNNWSPFTSDIYFEAYFYLSKRFGNPKILDDYKDGGTWDFTVKNYTIRVSLNSSWVNFSVFGEYRLQNCFTSSSYWVKRWREESEKRDLLIKNLDDCSKRSEYESKKIQQLLNNFQLEKNIPDDITPDKFNEKYGVEFWVDRINDFNNSIIDVKYEDYEKYGEYYNSKTNHALKTIHQFINNMLTPIWVRDCAFNIKGRMSDEEAYSMMKYKDNINIKFEL